MFAFYAEAIFTILFLVALYGFILWERPSERRAKKRK